MTDSLENTQNLTRNSFLESHENYSSQRNLLLRSTVAASNNSRNNNNYSSSIPGSPHSAASFRSLHQASSFLKSTMDRWMNRGSLEKRSKSSPSIYLSRVSHVQDFLEPSKNLPIPSSANENSNNAASKSGSKKKKNNNNNQTGSNNVNNAKSLLSSDDEDEDEKDNNTVDESGSNQNRDQFKKSFLRFAARKSQQPWFLYNNSNNSTGDSKDKNVSEQTVCILSLSTPSDSKTSVKVAKKSEKAIKRYFIKQSLSSEDHQHHADDDEDSFSSSSDDDDENNSHQSQKHNKSMMMMQGEERSQAEEMLIMNKESMLEPLQELSISTVVASCCVVIPKSSHNNIKKHQDHLPVDGAVSRIRQTFLTGDSVFETPAESIMKTVNDALRRRRKRNQQINNNNFDNFSFNNGNLEASMKMMNASGSTLLVSSPTVGNNNFGSGSYDFSMASFSSPTTTKNLVSDNSALQSVITIGKQLTHLKLQSKNQNRRDMFAPIPIEEDIIHQHQNYLHSQQSLNLDEGTSTSGAGDLEKEMSSSIMMMNKDENNNNNTMITYPLIDSHTICISNISPCKRYTCFSRVQVLTTSDIPKKKMTNQNSRVDHNDDIDDDDEDEKPTRTVCLAGNPSLVFGFSSKRTQKSLLENNNNNNSKTEDKKTSSSSSTPLLFKSSSKLTELVRVCANDSSKENFGSCLIPLGVSASDLESTGVKRDLEERLRNQLNSNNNKNDNNNNNHQVTHEDVSLLEFEFTFPLATSFSPQNEFIATVWNCEVTFEIACLRTEKVEADGLSLRRKHERMSVATTTSNTNNSNTNNNNAGNEDDDEDARKRREEQEVRTKAERNKRCRNLPKRSIFITRRVQVVVVFDLLRPTFSCLRNGGIKVLLETDQIHSENFVSYWRNLTRPRRSVKEFDTTAIMAHNNSSKSSTNNTTTNLNDAKKKNNKNIFILPTEEEESDPNGWFNKAVPEDTEKQSQLVIDDFDDKNLPCSWSKTEIQFNPWNSNVFSVLSNGAQISFWKIEEETRDTTEKDGTSTATTDDRQPEQALLLERLSSKKISLRQHHHDDENDEFADLPRDLMINGDRGLSSSSSIVISSHCWYDEDAIAFLTKNGVLCNAQLEYFEKEAEVVVEKDSARNENDSQVKRDEANDDERDSSTKSPNKTIVITADYEVQVRVVSNFDLKKKNTEKTQHDKKTNNHQSSSSSWIGLNCCMPQRSDFMAASAESTTSNNNNNDFSLFAIRSDGTVVQLLRRFAVISSSHQQEKYQMMSQSQNSQNIRSSASSLFELRDQFSVEQIFTPSSCLMSNNNTNNNNGTDYSSTLWPPSSSSSLRITSLSFCRDSTGSPSSDDDYWSTLHLCVSTNIGTRFWCALHHNNNNNHHHQFFDQNNDDDDDVSASATSNLDSLFPGILASHKTWTMIVASSQLAPSEYLNRQDDGNGRVTKWSSVNTNNNKTQSTKLENIRRFQKFQKDIWLGSCFSLMPSFSSISSTSSASSSSLGLKHFLAYRCCSNNRLEDTDIVLAIMNVSSSNITGSGETTTRMKTLDTFSLTQVGKIQTPFGMASSNNTNTTNNDDQQDDREQQQQQTTKEETTSTPTLSSSFNQDDTLRSENRIVSFALHPSGKSLCVVNPFSIRLFHATIGSGLNTNLRQRNNSNNSSCKNDDAYDDFDLSFEGGVHFHRGVSLQIPEVFRVEFDDTATVLIACQGKRIFVLDPNTLSINFIFDGHISAVQCFRFVYDENEVVAREKQNEKTEANLMKKKMNSSSNNDSESSSASSSSCSSSIPPKSIISADLSGNIHVWSLAPKKYQNYEFWLDGAPEDGDDENADHDENNKDDENDETGGGNLNNVANSDQADKKRRAKENLLREAERIHGLAFQSSKNKRNNNSSNAKYGKSSFINKPGSHYVGIEYHEDENNFEDLAEDAAAAGGGEIDLTLVPISGEAVHSIHLPNFLIADCIFAQNHRDYYNINNDEKKKEGDNQNNNNNNKTENDKDGQGNNSKEHHQNATNSFVSTAPRIVAAGRFKEDVLGECRKDGFALILTSIVDRKKILEFHRKQQQRDEDGSKKSNSKQKSSSNKYSIDLRGEFKKRKEEKKKLSSSSSPKKKSTATSGVTFADAESRHDDDHGDEKNSDDDDSQDDTSSNATSYVLSSHSETTATTSAANKNNSNKNTTTGMKKPKITHRQRQQDAVKRNHQIVIHTGVSYFSESSDKNWQWEKEDIVDLQSSMNNKDGNNKKGNNTNNSNNSNSSQQQSISATSALLNRLQSRRAAGRILELIRMRPRTVFVDEDELYANNNTNNSEDGSFGSSSMNMSQNFGSQHQQTSLSASLSPMMPMMSASFRARMTSSSSPDNNNQKKKKENGESAENDDDDPLLQLPYTSALLVGRPDGKVACYDYPIRISGTRPYQVLSVFDEPSDYYPPSCSNKVETTSREDEKNDDSSSVNNNSNNNSNNQLPAFLRSHDYHLTENQTNTAAHHHQPQQQIEITSMKYIPHSRILAVQSKEGSLAMIRLRNLEPVSSSKSGKNTAMMSAQQRKAKQKKASLAAAALFASQSDEVYGSHDNDDDDENNNKESSIFASRFKSQFQESLIFRPRRQRNRNNNNNDVDRNNNNHHQTQAPLFKLPARLMRSQHEHDDEEGENNINVNVDLFNDSQNQEEKKNTVEDSSSSTTSSFSLLPTSKSWFVDAVNPLVPVSKDFLFHLDNTRDKTREQIKKVEQESAQRVYNMTVDYDTWKKNLQSRSDAETNKLEREIQQELDDIRNVENYHESFVGERETQFQNTVDGVVLAQHQHEQDCIRKVEENEAKLEIMSSELDHRAENERREFESKLKDFTKEMEDHIAKVEKRKAKQEHNLSESLRQWDAMIRQTAVDFQKQHEERQKEHKTRLEKITSEKSHFNFSEHLEKQAQRQLTEDVEVLGHSIVQQKHDAEKTEEELARATNEKATLLSALRDIQRDSLSEDSRVRSLHTLRNRLDGVRLEMNRNYDSLFDSIATRDHDVENVQHHITSIASVLSIVTDEAVVLNRENQLVSAHLADQQRRLRLVEKAQIELKRVEKNALANVVSIMADPRIVKSPNVAMSPLKHALAETVVERRKVFQQLQRDLDDRSMLLTTRIGESGDLMLTRDEEERGRFGDSLQPLDDSEDLVFGKDVVAANNKKRRHHQDASAGNNSNNSNTSSGSTIKMPPEVRQILNEFKEKEERRAANNNAKKHPQHPSSVFASSVEKSKKPTPNRNNSNTNNSQLNQAEQAAILEKEEIELQKEQERLEALEKKRIADLKEREREARWQKAQDEDLRKRKLAGDEIRRENEEKLRREFNNQIVSVKRQRDVEMKKASVLHIQRDGEVAGKIRNTKALMDEIEDHKKACEESTAELHRLRYLDEKQKKKQQQQQLDEAELHHHHHQHQSLARMQSHPEPSPIGFLSDNINNNNFESSSREDHQQHDVTHNNSNNNNITELEQSEQEDIQRRFHTLPAATQHQRLTISQMRSAIEQEEPHRDQEQQQKQQYSIFNNINNDNNNNNNNNQNQALVQASTPPPASKQNHINDNDDDDAVVFSVPRNDTGGFLVGSPSKSLKRWKQPATVALEKQSFGIVNNNNGKDYQHQPHLRRGIVLGNSRSRRRVSLLSNNNTMMMTSSTDGGDDSLLHRHHPTQHQQELSPNEVLMMNINRSKHEVEMVHPVNLLAASSSSPSSQQQQRTTININSGNTNNNFPFSSSPSSPSSPLFKIGGGGGTNNNNRYSQQESSPKSNLIQEYQLAKKSVEAARKHRVFHSLQRKVLFDRTALIPRTTTSENTGSTNINNAVIIEEKKSGSNKKDDAESTTKKRQERVVSTSSPLPRSKPSPLRRNNSNNNMNNEEIDWTGTPKSGNSRASSAK